MTMLASIASIQEAARDLAQANREADADVLRTYWFRDTDEVRLVHVEATSLPSKKVTPFNFAADPAHGVPFRSAVALIRPEEAETIPLPDAWGASWPDAEIWDWQ